MRRDVIIITGASSGIGSQLARMFLKTHSIGLIARREDKLQTLAKELILSGASVAYRACDVTDKAAVTVAIQQIEAELGPTDCLVANAGFALRTSIHDHLSQPASEMMQTNFFGALYVIEAVLPGMILRKSGHIVGISSLASLVAAPGSGGYSASKAALKMFLDSLRRELSAYNISVSTICPGFIKSPLTSKNQYKMPFLLDLDAGTAKIYRAIVSRKAVFYFPWQMVGLLRLGRLLPLWLQDRLLKKQSYKKSEVPLQDWA